MTTSPNLPDERLEPRSGPPQERDLAQESLQSALRAGFRVLLGVMVVLVGLYFYSGIFQVETGWHTALPAPFDEQIRIEGSARTLTVETFCFARDEGSRRAGRALANIETGGDTLTPGVDGAMFTGDRNLSHALWTIQYRVARPQELVENVWAPPALRERETPEAVEPLLKRVADGTILRVWSGRPRWPGPCRSGCRRSSTRCRSASRS